MPISPTKLSGSIISRPSYGRPGTVTMGYGVIDGGDDEVKMVSCGALSKPARSPIGERLNYMHNGILDIISRYQPDAVAVEQPFMAKNARAALAIGQVKQRVADYGASSKEQIQEMVRLQLGLPEVPRPDDAADALAVALCHLHEVHLNRLLAEE